MKQLSLEKKVQIIHLLVEGTSMRSAARIADVTFKSVAKLLMEVGSACIWFHNSQVRNVHARRVQCDEIWQFVYAKDKNIPPEKRGKGTGDVWTWVAMDADTKLVISWYTGNRDAESGAIFMNDLARRVANRIQLTTDGLLIYPELVEGAFRGRIDYAVISKVFGVEAEKERKYSPNHVKEIKRKVMVGFPDPDCISTSYVERQNMSMRMGMRRFTRLTNGFSKKVMFHKYAIALHFVYQNFCRIHTTLRVTPAMEAGLTKDIMEIEDLISLTTEY